METHVDYLLKFKRIEAYFVYGFVQQSTEEEKSIETIPFEKTWSPTYYTNYGETKFNRWKSESINNLSVVSASGKEVLDNVEMEVFYVKNSIGDRVPGSLTIKLTVTSSEEAISLDEIFCLLKLLPRTTTAISKDYSKLQCNSNQLEEFLTYSKEFVRKNNSEKISCKNIWEEHFSDLFKIFVNSMFKFQPGWTELSSVTQSESLYEFDNHKLNDPQIPIMFLAGYQTPETFESNFWFDGSTQDKSNEADSSQDIKNHKLAQEIGALISVWLDPKNKREVNVDYYSQYKESNTNLKGNRFVSRYRDKKSFVVFSSLLTLDIICDYDDETKKKATTVTKNSILHFLEFNKIRQHYSIWINKELDRLNARLRKHSGTEELIKDKEYLNGLRIDIVSSLNNPINYMWDSILGQEIPELISVNNINLLEKATDRKLNHISDIIKQKIEVSKSHEILNAIKNIK